VILAIVLFKFRKYNTRPRTTVALHCTPDSTDQGV
jgi:hypothetical protein